MNKNSKIYIAGHTGMVGSALVEKFEKEGFSNLILKTRKNLNLLNQLKVKSFFSKEKPEYVIISAAKVGGIKANMNYPTDFLYENLQIQNNIIYSALQNNVKKLLFLGSSCIYPKNCFQPIKEEYLLSGKLEPTNEGYAMAKIAGLKLCEKIYEQFGKKFISCMPTNIYGKRDNFDYESAHVIPALIRRMHEAKLKNLKQVEIWGSGKSKREFLYVEDLADAIFWIVKNYNEKDFLNIGTGKDISIKELAFTIKKIIGYKGNLIFDKTKPDGMPRKLLDISKIEKLGWEPKTHLEDGIKETYKWFIGKI